MARVGSVILCGGESRRMGRSKAHLEIDGEPMLLHVLRAVRIDDRPVVVACREGQALPPLPDDVSAVADPVAGVGPLGGLWGGLAALAQQCDIAFVCACDQAMLLPAFVSRMIERWDGHSVVVAQHGERLHPLTGVYRTDLVPQLQAQIESGDYRVRSFIAQCNALLLSGEEFRDIDPDLLSLKNFNTPEDLSV